MDDALQASYDRLEQTLRGLRIPPGSPESHIHQAIAGALHAQGVAFVHEARLAPRCRVDFLVEGGIALEVKCKKPGRAALLSQLARYAAQPGVEGLLLVVERSAHLPGSIGGKPCRTFGLNRLWGIALR